MHSVNAYIPAVPIQITMGRSVENLMLSLKKEADRVKLLHQLSRVPTDVAKQRLLELDAQLSALADQLPAPKRARYYHEKRFGPASVI